MLDESSSAILKADPGLANLCGKMEKENQSQKSTPPPPVQKVQTINESNTFDGESDKSIPASSNSGIDALIDGDVRSSVHIPRPMKEVKPKIKVSSELKEFEVLPDQSPTQAVSQIPTVPPVKPVITAPEKTEPDSKKKITPPPSDEPVKKDDDSKDRIILLENKLSDLLTILCVKDLITEKERNKLSEGLKK